jgi:hypothetical protein
MAKAGLIEEMMNDAIDSTLDNESIEEETEEEIEKVSCCWIETNRVGICTNYLYRGGDRGGDRKNRAETVS